MKKRIKELRKQFEKEKRTDATYAKGQWLTYSRAYSVWLEEKVLVLTSKQTTEESKGMSAEEYLKSIDCFDTIYLNRDKESNRMSKIMQQYASQQQPVSNPDELDIDENFHSFLASEGISTIAKVSKYGFYGKIITDSVNLPELVAKWFKQYKEEK